MPLVKNDNKANKSNVNVVMIKSNTKISEYRSSHPEVLLETGVLKIYNKFTGEHPRRGVISIKLQHLYWNHISAWLFSCRFAAYFQKTFFKEHLLVAASENNKVSMEKIHFSYYWNLWTATITLTLQKILDFVNCFLLKENLHYREFLHREINKN